jgi:hypothetical protein
MPCGIVPLIPLNTNTHALACNSQKRLGPTVRHDLALLVIDDFLTSIVLNSGIECYVQPTEVLAEQLFRSLDFSRTEKDARSSPVECGGLERARNHKSAL